MFTPAPPTAFAQDRLPCDLVHVVPLANEPENFELPIGQAIDRVETAASEDPALSANGVGHLP